MTENLEHLLADVLQDKAAAEEPQQPALDTGGSDAFSNRVTQTFRYTLPETYLKVLAQTDGLDCNGVVLYASRVYAEGERFVLQGFTEANILLRGFTPNRDFLYFAESGMDFYRHNLQTGKFEISARVGGTVFNSFATAEELFTQIFNHMLGNYDDEDDSETDS